jgi:transcriptional regulator with XRE-family HTH domain
MEAFHLRLRQLRKTKGFTIKSFAQKIEISPSTYRDWEYGVSIQGQPYLKIAQALDVSLYELFGSEEPPRTVALCNLSKKLEVLSNELKKEVLTLS